MVTKPATHTLHQPQHSEYPAQVTFKKKKKVLSPLLIWHPIHCSAPPGHLFPLHKEDLFYMYLLLHISYHILKSPEVCMEKERTDKQNRQMNMDRQKARLIVNTWKFNLCPQGVYNPSGTRYANQYNTQQLQCRDTQCTFTQGQRSTQVCHGKMGKSFTEVFEVNLKEQVGILGTGSGKAFQIE